MFSRFVSVTFTLLCSLVAGFSQASEVIGHLDRVYLNGSTVYASGWACQEGDPQSIGVHLYINGPAGTGSWIAASTANASSGSAVAAECGTSGVSHGFNIVVPPSKITQYPRATIYAHGISIQGTGNNLLSGSHPIPAEAYEMEEAQLVSPSNGSKQSGTPCFEWSKVDNADSYTVQLSSDINFNASSKRWVKNGITGTSTCWGSSFVANPTAGSTPDYLGAGATYYWRVRSDNSYGSTFSGYRSFRINIPVPDISLASSDSDGNFTVSWSNVENIIGDASLAGYELSENGTKITGILSNSYARSKAEGTYSYQVSACISGKGCGSLSSSKTIVVDLPNQVPTISPSSPGNNAQIQYGNSLTARATANDIDGSITQVEFNVDGGNWEKDTDSPYAHNFDQLSPGLHSICFQAKDDEGAYSKGTACRSVSVTLKLANLTSPLNGVTVRDTPEFKWGPVEGAAYYTVQVSSDIYFNADSERWVLRDLENTQAQWSDLFEPNDTALAAATAEGRSATKLVSGRTYYWRIKAMDKKTEQWPTASFSSYRAMTVNSGAQRKVTYIHTDILGSPIAESN